MVLLLFGLVEATVMERVAAAAAVVQGTTSSGVVDDSGGGSDGGGEGHCSHKWLLQSFFSLFLCRW